MPTLEHVSRLLSMASALLAHAMPVEAAAGQDITESIRAALQDVHAIERRLFELQPGYGRDHGKRHGEVVGNRLLIECMGKALELEEAKDLEQALAAWRAFLAQRLPDLHYSIATLEIDRLEATIQDARPDGPLDETEQARVDALSPAQLEEIDQALLAAADERWRKVAMIVATVMSRRGIPGVPDVFYAQRVARLVERGHLEAVGDLGRMRWSEVRLPASGQMP